MSVLAAIIDWNDPEPPLSQISLLLSALSDRGIEERGFCRTKHSILGFGKRVVRYAQRREIQPFRDDQRRICAVGDVRLDNRQELKDRLDGSRPLDSDIAIVVAAYERWGDETAENLLGDFAFVIWDASRQEVYAARDPFGVRPLVFRTSPGRVIFATDAAQLLALPDTDRSPNDATVVGYLSWTLRDYGPTFFRAIRSVQPGHYLRATSGTVRESEYFRPPTVLLQRSRVEDYEEEFRCIFGKAVRDRLDSDYPIVAHLSGGLDSSSIVCMADRIYREASARPPLHTASALFPAQSYDERSFVEAVTQTVGFQSHSWNGNLPSRREFSCPAVGIPGASVTLAGGSVGDLEIAKELGARVILTGTPGDYVTGEIGLFNELLVKGKWLTVLGQVMSSGSRRERAVRLKLVRQAMGQEAPAILRRLWRSRDLLKRPDPPPNWLGKDVRHLWVDPRFRGPRPLKRGINRLQEGVWSALRWSWLSWAVDMLGSYSADAGIETRYPFLDARLVTFMLSVPCEHRLIGRLRRSLHRRAMTGILPVAIAQRASKPVFNGAVVQWGRANLEPIRELVDSTNWRSGRFVDQQAARGLLTALASKDEADVRDREGWIRMRAIVNIEAWHQAIFRYPRTKEILPMSETPTTSEVKRGECTQVVSQASPYVPPQLTPVGNVRTLLAVGMFSGDDGNGAPSGETPPG